MSEKPAITSKQAALLLCALWTIETFVVQELTLVPGAGLSTGEHLLRSAARLPFVVGCFAALIAMLPAVALLVIFAVQFIFFVLAISYFDFFHSPLSILQAWYNFGEGADLGVKVAEMLSWSAFIALQVTLTLKLWLALRIKRDESEFLRRLRAGGGLVGVLGLLAAMGVYFGTRPAGVATFTQLGSSYGYFVAGVWELQYTRHEQLLARALEVSGRPEDVLSAVEYPFEIHERFILIQVESLDWGILDFEIGGKKVMPFMSGLVKKSALYRIEAYHLHGSGDADFMALSGVYPSIDVLNYKIPDFPYDDPLPAFLRKLGYHTVSLHNVSGDYFDRRPAFEKMGFDEIHFLEELQRDYGYVPEGWGVVDGDLFDASADKLSKIEGPVFHFLITVSSHGPFRPGRDPDEKIASGKNIDERYFNAMRYVDNVLEKYVKALPPQTTVAFYGDHNSGVQYPGYESGVQGLREHVPFILYNMGENLAEMQKTREGPYGAGGQLDLVRMMAFVRARVQASARKQETP